MALFKNSFTFFPLKNKCFMFIIYQFNNIILILLNTIHEETAFCILFIGDAGICWILDFSDS